MSQRRRPLQVHKVGGSCLGSAERLNQVVAVIAGAQAHADVVLVLSALPGVTDRLSALIEASPLSEPQIVEELGTLRAPHQALAAELLADPHLRLQVEEAQWALLASVERLLVGASYTGEVTPRLTDLVLCHGERLAVPLLVGLLRQHGIPAVATPPERIGLRTDGVFGNATVDAGETLSSVGAVLFPHLVEEHLPVVEGFYGIDGAGEVTTFGRGGSDYSAAVLAAVLGADELVIWKDVEGFLSADPTLVPHARLVPQLSYREAAELSYFGAKILHPRTVEPLAPTGVPLRIRPLADPSAAGTTVGQSPHSDGSAARPVVCAVASDAHIGVLKLHGVGVGARPGVLGELTALVGDAGYNIRSVVTAQTCIALLLEAADLQPVARLVRARVGPPIERIELLPDRALVAIVGEGVLQTPGVAAGAFSAIAAEGINVELVSAGASEVAYYLVVSRSDLPSTVGAIHRWVLGGSVPPGAANRLVSPIPQ